MPQDWLSRAFGGSRNWRHFTGAYGIGFWIEACLLSSVLEIWWAGNLEAFTPHLPPYLAHAIDREVVRKDPHHLGLQRLVASRTGGLSCRIAALCDMLMLGLWGDRQNPADRLDPIDLPMRVNKGDHRLNGRSNSA